MSGIGHLVMSGPLILAIAVAAAAGAITFASPCCPPLMPGCLAYLTGMSGADAGQVKPTAPGSPASRGRAVAGTALFADRRLRTPAIGTRALSRTGGGASPAAERLWRPGSHHAYVRRTWPARNRRGRKAWARPPGGAGGLAAHGAPQPHGCAAKPRAGSPPGPRPRARARPAAPAG